MFKRTTLYVTAAILLGISLQSQSALAVQSPAYTYSESKMCAKAPYPVGGSFSRFISNATGTNFLLTKVASSTIEKELKKQLNSKFDVQIKAYGGKNLIDGKFKSFAISSKQISSDELNVSDFSANSICEFNQIALKNNEIFFVENFLMDFNAKITDADLKKTILSPSYLNLIEKLNLNVGNFVVFKLYDPTIELKNNRIYMTVKTITPNFMSDKTQTIKIDAGIKIEDEKIVFSDINLGSSHNLNLNSVLPLVNRLNPFVFKTKIDNNNTATIKIKDVKIANNAIYSKGVVILPKSAPQIGKSK